MGDEDPLRDGVTFADAFGAAQKEFERVPRKYLKITATIISKGM